MREIDHGRRVASPEWVVAGRGDLNVDETLSGGWGVSPAPLVRGASFTNFAVREMAVPTGDTPSDLAVRTHELIHARISPTAVPAQLMEQLGVSTASVRLAEEVRVNFVANANSMARHGHAGTWAMADGSEKGMAKKCVEDKNWQNALNLYLTTFNTDVHKIVKRTLRTNVEWREPFEIIEKEMREWNAKHKNQHYDHRVASTEVARFSYVEGRYGEKKTVLLGDGFTSFTIPLANRIDEWLVYPPTKTPKKGEGRFDRTFIPRRRGMNSWGEMRFGMTSLTETTTAFLGKRKRPAMTGKYPSRPDRLLTDPERRIFRETVRAEGGVVVFDCSGSMSVSHDEVKEVVKKFAGATIVAYTYRGKYDANTWVLARNGRMISETEFRHLDFNNGNGVDGHVLRWAIRQKKHPKDFILWVSDGYVTGINDVCSDNLVRECAELSVRHNIIGANHADEALEILDGMKRLGQRPYHKFVPFIAHHVKRGRLNHE